jgi:hypothetical protein
MNSFGKKSVVIAEKLVGPFDWRRVSESSCTTFEGRFLIYDRAGDVADYVRGRISFRNSQAAEVYLFDPPAYVAKHPHARCLQLLAPDSRWFKLHFEKPATTFGDAYTFVEHMLTEAFNLTH